MNYRFVILNPNFTLEKDHKGNVETFSLREALIRIGYPNIKEAKKDNYSIVELKEY